MREEILVIHVKKYHAERVRRILQERRLLNHDFRAESSEDCVYFPLVIPDKFREKQNISSSRQEAIQDFYHIIFDRMDNASGIEYELLYKNMERAKKKPASYKDIVDIPDNLRHLLPSSFDIIGSIAIVKLDEGLMKFAERIGNAICSVYKNVKSVAIDRGVQTALRLRSLQLVCGDDIGDVIHRENNLRFKLNPSKVYFSPRLSGERKRVSSTVEDGEKVLDMFAGIGPFSILIAREHDVKIIANDLNSDAIRYFRENISLNRVNGIKLVNTDARKIRLKGANRVIMNLPHDAFSYFPLAISILDIDSYPIINYYEIVNSSILQERVKEIRNVAERVLSSLGNPECNIEIMTKKVHGYSPSLDMYSFDIKFIR